MSPGGAVLDVYAQSGFSVRLGWGPRGVSLLAADSDAVVIVDVLSFSTCVTVAVERGAAVYPCRFKDHTAADLAASVGAELAVGRGERSGRYSLSPASLMQARAGDRIVLPSPNGATLSTMTGTVPTFAGCLRNASAVARAAGALGPRVSVIAAGERWPDDGTLRPALEDLLGAGAVLAAMPGDRSPEAQAAVAAFSAASCDLERALSTCGSGQELIARGFPDDVRIAAVLDACAVAPRRTAGAYRG